MANDKNKPPEKPPQKPPPPPPPPKPLKMFRKYTVRVYVIDGAYNGEMVDEFVFKAPHFKTFGGSWVKEGDACVQELLESIGKNGYTIKTPSNGKLYYPPHRIYYVEAERVVEDDDD